MLIDQQVIGKLRDHFGYATWRDRNKLSEGLFIRNFTRRREALPRWNTLRADRVSGVGRPDGIQMIWSPTSGDREALLRVSVYECASRRAAHEFLIHILANFQSAHIGLREDLDIGDVVFSGPEDAVLVFARANLAVVLARGGRTAIPASEIGRRLDQELVFKPTASQVEATPSAIQRFTHQSAHPSLKEPIPLRWELQPDLAEQAYIKLFYSSGEIEIMDGQIVLLPEKRGRVSLSLYTIQPDNRFSAQSLELGIDA